MTLRVLHFPTDVGGHPSTLSRAERTTVDSTVAVTHGSWLRYPVDIDLGVDPTSKWSDLTARSRFLARAVRAYDVFHFNFGQSFLPQLAGCGIDLPMLRALGKRVFVTFQGCDARQQSFCAANFEVSCCGQRQGEGLCTPDEDRRKVRRVAYARRWAHRVFAVNPDLLHVIPDGEFVPYAAIDPAGVEVVPPRATGPLRILHAPTNRLVKGTDHVLAAVEALRGRFEFEFRIIEHVAHDEALALYRDADLVIDQLRVGWYGAFAVELMALGKPVLAYVREDDLRFVPEQMARELPIVRATPDDLEATLADLLAHPERLRERGAESRAFVERWHDPARIAARMLAVYDDPKRSFWREAEAG